MARTVFVGHQNIAGVRSADAWNDGAGALSWSVLHGAHVNAVATDPSGTLYIGGNTASGGTTRKYSPGGALLWSADHGAHVQAICVDAAGNVYTAGNNAGGVSVRAYNSSGTLLWSGAHGATLWGICVDEDGFVYAVGTSYLGTNARCWTSGGTLKWTWNVASSAQLESVAARGGVLAIGGARSWSVTTRAFAIASGNDSVPTALWSADHGADVYGVAIGTDGSVHSTGLRSPSGHTTRKYTGAGSLLWSADHGVSTSGITVDSAGSVYVAGSWSADNYTCRKWDSGGSLLWSFNVGDVSAYAIAVFETAGLSLPIPGAGVALAGGTPSWGYAFSIGSAAVALRAAAPGAVTGRPPDVAIERPEPLRYRLWIASGTDLVELPMAWLQCNRRLGASTWLTVSVPQAAPAISDWLVGVLGAADIVIDAARGDTSGVFLRAVLTEVSTVRDAGASTVTLTGRVQTPSYSRETRAAQGVSSRARDGQRRSVRCVVDPLLRPNDTLLVGADQWVVGAVLYRLSPTESWMDVTESS